MMVTSLMPRARYHQWANVQLTDFLLQAEQTGSFVRHEETRSKVHDVLCRTMAVDCRWLDRLEGREVDNYVSRFEDMDFAVLLKARSLLDARLMAAVKRIGTAAADETVTASNGIKIGLTAVVRFMLARNQRQRSHVAGILSALEMMPPLMGERLFEARTRKFGQQPEISNRFDSPALAAVG